MKNNHSTDEPNANDSTESWQEVGHQFEVLGVALAQAFRSAWGNIENNPDAQQVKSGIETIVREVGHAIDETVKSPEGQKVAEEAKRTANKLRNASEQTADDARPQIIKALRQINEELDHLISKLDDK
jgi:hypothetical protein